MQKLLIEGNEIIYFKRDELLDADLGADKDLYEETYRLAELMSKQLKIKCPNIGLINEIRRRDDMGRLSVEGAVMYTPKDVPALKNNLIMMSLEDFDNLQYIGTLAHEMRHIWQDKYHPEMNKNHAKGFGESLTHPAEIDADGYAIWYISEAPEMYIDKAAGIMCPEEKKHHPKEYMYRIEKAKEIQAFFEEQRKKMAAEIEASKKQKSASILDKIKNIFT